MQFTLNVEVKTFVNDKNESITYNECTAVVGGETIRFAPKAADKKLFDHLVSQIKVVK